MIASLSSFRRSFPATGPGMIVSPELRALSERPGFLKLESGGQRMRNLYVDGSAAFEPSLLSDFGLACFMGLYDEVKKMVDSGTAPDICGHETQYRHGYLTLVVSGRQRLKSAHPSLRHGAVAKYLIEHVCPPNLPDIAGYTALQHATIRDAVLDIARILLEGGADPNHQNKYGCTALMDTCLTGLVKSIDLLLEFGADPTIPDADGCQPNLFCLKAGPEVTAVFTKWARKRAGTTPAAREAKQCDACSKPPPPDKPLHVCTRCKIARYCDVNCQRAHWPTHKVSCNRARAAATLTMQPFYPSAGTGTVFSGAALARSSLGIPDPFKAKNPRDWGAPPARTLPKSLVIKVQLPLTSPGHCLVYTKKRDLMCNLRAADNPSTYSALVDVIRTRGAGGLKAYFAAELVRRDELVIKVDEVLAEQPF